MIRRDHKPPLSSISHIVLALSSTAVLDDAAQPHRAHHNPPLLRLVSRVRHCLRSGRLVVPKLRVSKLPDTAAAAAARSSRRHVPTDVPAADSRERCPDGAHPLRPPPRGGSTVVAQQRGGGRGRSLPSRRLRAEDGAARLLAPLVTRPADASRRRTAAATPRVALRMRLLVTTSSHSDLHFEFVDTPGQGQGDAVSRLLLARGGGAGSRIGRGPMLVAPRTRLAERARKEEDAQGLHAVFIHVTFIHVKDGPRMTPSSSSSHSRMLRPAFGPNAVRAYEVLLLAYATSCTGYAWEARIGIGHPDNDATSPPPALCALVTEAVPPAALKLNAPLTAYIPRSHHILHFAASSASASAPTPLAPPFFLLCASSSSSSPRRLLLVTRLRIAVGLHRDTLARCPPQGLSTPVLSSLAAWTILPQRHRHTHRVTGETPSAVHTVEAEGRADGKRTGGLTQDRGLSPSASDSRPGVYSARRSLFASFEEESVVDARARSVGRMSRTPRLPPLGRDASAPTFRLQCIVFLRGGAPDVLFPPSGPSLPFSRLCAQPRRVDLLLISSTPPVPGSPHETRRSALPPWLAGGLAAHRTRRLVVPRGEDDAGRGDARSTCVHHVGDLKTRWSSLVLLGRSHNDGSRHVSQSSPRPPRTPPISLPRAPTFSTSRCSGSPHRVCRRSSTVSAAWAPAILRTVMAFRVRNLDGAQMDREVRGGCARVQALVRRGGRRKTNNGMGREASDRTTLVLGGRL
ncbi:hypothetical protein DFH07DRAFT_1058376 [Mycena maculata]|uniref:Uncharacterized protein n=1 Tax=Mycena maculata TaxID=230809 RepID=A0AAD7NMX7_9AGAR|nr:hypothetical protein DFH07DRAFT_1058376 [Mycena maculata]